MLIDFLALVGLAGSVVSAIAEQLKIIQNPDIDDQDKMAVVAGMAMIATLLIVIGQHLVTAPTALLNWADIWNIAQTWVGVLLSTQAYHFGINKILDAIVSAIQAKSEGIQKKTSLIVGPNG